MVILPKADTENNSSSGIKISHISRIVAVFRSRVNITWLFGRDCAKFYNTSVSYHSHKRKIWQAPPCRKAVGMSTNNVTIDRSEWFRSDRQVMKWCTKGSITQEYHIITVCLMKWCWGRFSWKLQYYMVLSETWRSCHNCWKLPLHSFPCRETW